MATGITKYIRIPSRWIVYFLTNPKESLSIVIANFGPGHPLEAPVWRVTAHLLRKTGHKKEARTMDQQALEIEQARAHAAHGGAYTVDVEELRSMRQR